MAGTAEIEVLPISSSSDYTFLRGARVGGTFDLPCLNSIVLPYIFKIVCLRFAWDRDPG